MNQLRDGPQLAEVEDKGVSPHQKDPADRRRSGDSLEPDGQHTEGVRAPELGLLEVALNVRHRRQAEGKGQILVEGAEFAAVVGAARCDLQQQGGGLVGGTPDGACVVHSAFSFFVGQGSLFPPSYGLRRRKASTQFFW